VSGQHHAPADLPPGKTRYPLYRRVDGLQGRYGQVRKISLPTGFRSPDRPACGESLYRLSYRGPNLEKKDLRFVTLCGFSGALSVVATELISLISQPVLW
jgi:hypothetical protein